MNRPLRDPALTLNQGISGFRQYELTNPVRLSFVSQNLCRMLGVTLREFHAGRADRYESFVHPDDVGRYRRFLGELLSGASGSCTQYRLIRKDGTVLFVRDTATVAVLDDGTRIAEAALAEYPAYDHGADMLPCGFMRFTCEAQPKITRINRPMLEILRLPESREGEADYLELYREDLFLMLPMEERRRFSRYLELVRTKGTPITGETNLLRCDGTKAHVFGWITCTENPAGEPEFQAVCMDVTTRYQARKDLQTQRYLKALTDVYEKIFVYDRSIGTVKCIHDSRASRFSLIRDIPMQMTEATRHWISETVLPKDQDRLMDFFRTTCEHPVPRPDAAPPRITYEAVSGSGETCLYDGVVLTVDDSVCLYCCRRASGSGEAEALRSENDSLKENMQELIQRFTDGLAAFQIRDGLVTPLYVTDNLCRFFGRTRDEWLPLMKKATPVREFVSQSAVDYEQFAQLLQNGEAEFTYLNLETGQPQQMKAICSHKTASPGATRYVMLYSVEPEEAQSPVYLRTFGYFDVFVGDSPIAFRNQKSKELLALLVDRRGGFITSEEAITYLWEEEPVNPVTLARYRKVALRLKNILTEYGIADIVENVDGKRRIVPQKVRCDLFDYLTGQEQYAQLFKGSYLSNYSWGETTLAELTGDMLYDSDR